MMNKWWEAHDRSEPRDSELALLRDLCARTGPWKEAEGYQRPPPGVVYVPKTGVLWSEGHVAKLELPKNELRGDLPKLEALENCRVLCLFGNALTAARSFPASLTHLDLSGNQFSGPFPASITSLFRLKRLHLEKNSFSGPLPIDLELSQLQIFTAFQNSFTGPLPTFSGCGNLETIWLHDNPQLGDSIPISDDLVTICPRLTSLLLSFTTIPGPPPPELVQRGCDVQLRPADDGDLSPKEDADDINAGGPTQRDV